MTAAPYINLGKIRGIDSWGYNVGTWSGATLQFSWIHGYPSLSNSITFGSAAAEHYCRAFNLSTNDYINGYRVITKGNNVFGLTFYTHLNLTHQCQWEFLDLLDMNDSGIIRYPGYYLSGFYMTAYVVINQIGFQFTSVAPSTSGIYLLCLFVKNININITISIIMMKYAKTYKHVPTFMMENGY